MELVLSDGSVTLIDDEDAELVSGYTWHPHSHGYAVAGGGQPLLHRLIMGNPPGVLIDHDNGDKRDNRRSNLKRSDFSRNARNRHAPTRNAVGITGARFISSGKIAVQIWCKNKVKHIGVFSTFNDAVQARAKAELDLFGDLSPHTRQLVESIKDGG